MTSVVVSFETRFHVAAQADLNLYEGEGQGEWPWWSSCLYHLNAGITGMYLSVIMPDSNVSLLHSFN